ncbi:response regulator [Flavobacterium sp. WC2421]|jgi:signal transduction histidine kinase/CheY-like chemotaxis protein|uniref:histidine kinase n=1 Tax=Flavobacterium sp. WC2409 TaxID=3234139 RepID=A0AB39W557_9FLAO
MLQSRIIFFIFFSLNLFSSNSVTDKIKPSRKEIVNLTNKASQYLQEFNYEKSFATARKALKHSIDAKDDILIAKSYNTIAGNYDELSEYDKAIFFYKKGLFYANKTSNDTVKNSINNNLGNIYCFEVNQLAKGLNYYKKSLDYSLKIADSSQIYITKMNIAWAYFYIGNFKNGKPYLDFITKYKNRLGDNTTIVALNMLNGMYYTSTSDYDKANSFFIDAIKLGNSGIEKSDLSYSHEEYAKLLLKTGKYKEAYENLALFNKIRKELEQSDKLKRAEVIGVNLELDEYKRKVDKIENEKDLQYQSLKKSRIIVFLFIIAFSVVLLLLYTVYKNYNFKKKKNAELVIANEELSIAKEKAEVASQLKSQFVSTISHELRTPLYGVVGITNMLLDEHKELADSPHLSSLKFSARYLLSLVNDVLQINKIEENRIVLESLTFNITDEINMIKNSLSFIAKNHNNEINVTIDPAIPEYLIGDKLRFSQIIINLVSNALKFTDNGKVDISANLIKVENKFNYIEFKIQDNGVGIAIEDQEKIFEKFVQVGRKEIDYQGTGLGLSIVKRLLELFNSAISLQSEIGKGTTFIFEIAFECDPAKTVEIINKIHVDLTSSEIFSVLVVDDNTINQLITKKIIEKNNYKCSVVSSGFLALEILEKETFDVILMDINMPLMNGFETTRRVRNMGIKTPIVALTAFDKDEIIEESLSAGFNDIIVKPFESVILFKTINNLIYKEKESCLI